MKEMVKCWFTKNMANLFCFSMSIIQITANQRSQAQFYRNRIGEMSSLSHQTSSNEAVLRLVYSKSLLFLTFFTDLWNLNKFQQISLSKIAKEIGAKVSCKQIKNIFYAFKSFLLDNTNRIILWYISVFVEWFKFRIFCNFRKQKI